MKDANILNMSEVTIYKDSDGPAIEVSFEGETVWLSSAQMATLFQRDINTINGHIVNVFKEGELLKEKTSLKQANTGNTGIGLNKPVTFYNLDVIISVGYRVKSKRGTQFRIWATQRLRDYLLKGFTVNQERLKEQSQAKVKELEGAVKLLQRVIATRKAVGMEKELLLVMTEYASTWTTLVHFDENTFPVNSSGGRVVLPPYEDLCDVVAQFSARLAKDKLTDTGFGEQRGGRFKQIVESLRMNQLSMAEAGAALFYSIIKEQPFAAGNKQVASLLLLVYLVKNNSFYNRRGERKLDDATMVALAVLVEESSPQDKVIVLQLIASMINQK